MFVYKRMTKDPITVNKEVSISDAMEVMRVSKIRRLPVIDKDNKLVGIVTDRDLHMASPSYASTLSKFEANYLLTKMKVSEIMSKEVFTVKESATIEEVALIMYKNKIGGVPVVAEDDSKRLVGIITETDIFKILVDMMGLPKGKIRITATFKDKMGMLADIGMVFKNLNQNITSFAILDDVSDEADLREIVIRGDFDNTDEIKAKLEEIGFTVIDITKIS